MVLVFDLITWRLHIKKPLGYSYNDNDSTKLFIDYPAPKGLFFITTVRTETSLTSIEKILKQITDSYYGEKITEFM